MTEILPAELYTGVFYNVLLLASVVLLMGASSVPMQDAQNLKNKQALGFSVLAFCILFIGFRPVSGRYFGDMRVYATTFERYADGESVILEKDVYFQYFMKWATGVMTMETFFFLCACLYIVPLYLFSRRLFKEYWAYGFMALVLSFSFWSFGVNGIRNGISTSMLLLGFSYPNLRHYLVAFMLAVGAHRSALIILTGWVVSARIKNPKLALAGWFAAIPVSLVLGSFWEAFFLKFGFGEEERLQGYLGEGEDDFQEVSTGFRWDFILYSGMGVYAGWFFIIKKKFEDVLYTRLYVLYLIMNGFWILIIRAAFSNRFAYLSWFLLGAVIFYPMLKVQFFKNQHKVVTTLLFVYFMITYALNFVIPRL